MKKGAVTRADSRRYLSPTSFFHERHLEPQRLSAHVGVQVKPSGAFPNAPSDLSGHGQDCAGGNARANLGRNAKHLRHTLRGQCAQAPEANGQLTSPSDPRCIVRRHSASRISGKLATEMVG